MLFQVPLFPTPNDLAHIFSLHDRIIVGRISKGVRLAVCDRNRRICQIQRHEKAIANLLFSKFLQLDTVS